MKKILALTLCLSTSTMAFAWGREGHRLVALIADTRLTPEAAAQVHYLLGKETLADVAPFADDYRQSHSNTGPWHFVDIPLDQQRYDRDRDCPVPAGIKAGSAEDVWRDCAVDRIPYFIGQLKNPALSKDDHAFALKMLVHIVGDLHQPLHAMGDARGGNQILVSFRGTSQCGERQRCNLHGVWDEGLIEDRGLNEKKYDAQLESEIAAHGWDRISQENPTVWANQSHQLAVEGWVPNGAAIGKDYYDTEIQVVDRQLAVAGIRLARILNNTLPKLPPPPADAAK